VLETLQQTKSLNQNEDMDIKCEDWTNKGEFVTESEPTKTTLTTPAILQQCGKDIQSTVYNGVEWSNLSQTQKKKIKAKIKIQLITNELKDINLKAPESKSLKTNDPINDHIETNCIIPKLIFNDPLVVTIQNLLDLNFNGCTLKKEDIENVIADVNSIGAPD